MPRREVCLQSANIHREKCEQKRKSTQNYIVARLSTDFPRLTLESYLREPSSCPVVSSLLQ